MVADFDFAGAHTADCAAPPDAAEGSELLYYQHVLRHKDSTAYFEAMANAGPEQMLRNITDQVYELSLICKLKLDNLRGFAVSFKWTVMAWCVSTAIGFWIIARK